MLPLDDFQECPLRLGPRSLLPVMQEPAARRCGLPEFVRSESRRRVEETLPFIPGATLLSVASVTSALSVEGSR